ncbi:FMN-binding protein [Clostridium bovifaecis]|uniref:FMN-binding protein n=1 Tax=Clostridium bovifaecis TaxID=2184719 RepID=A0A6I6F074_9CLOT|nr:FMN-binding protein [Clostridium bovifaecis]
MIPDKMLEVLKHEGVVALVTEGKEGAHVVNTWNSYIRITEDERLLLPAGYMNTTEANIQHNDKVLITVGSREVQGFNGPGTGFLIDGSAKFVKEGSEFDEMKQRFPWARATVEVTIKSATQTL